MTTTTPAALDALAAELRRAPYVATSRAADALDALRAQVETLTTERDAAKYIPGNWRCPKCNFRLLQSNLNSADGTVTARDKPGDRCPNCDGPLWRVSYQDEVTEAYAIATSQMERALAADTARASAEAALAEAREALRTARESIVSGFGTIGAVARIDAALERKP